MTSRRRFIAGAATTGLGVSFAPSILRAAAARRPPNILLLFPDQWRFDWMTGTAGLPIGTPHLDRLARSGTRLTNNVVASPLCAPSRACLASGRTYERCGVRSNNQNFPYTEIPTFYGMLRQSGYHVLACGKMDLAKAAHTFGLDGKLHVNDWGFSDQINNPGKFDQLGTYRHAGNRPVDPYLLYLQKQGTLQEHLADFRSRQGNGYGATFPTPLPDSDYCDNWLAGNGIALLNAAPRDKPWFLQVNFTGPHDPEDITRRMEQTVRGRTMPPVNGHNEFDAPTNRLIRQNYTAMCENIDRQIGVYLDWLERHGQLDNTLIVFSSDHGEMLGDHGRWGKTVPYHASAAVPLVVAGPGVRRGITSDALTVHIDIAATCLDYAGLPVPTGMDGRTLRPLLEGRAARHRNVAFSALGDWRMLYDGRYKAVTGFDPSVAKKRDSRGQTAPLVWDRLSDPGENVALTGTLPLQAKRLLKALG